MRSHGCVFAKYCHSYQNDFCQGCSRNYANWPRPTNPVVEELKKIFTKEETMTYTDYAVQMKNRLNRNPAKAANPLDISHVIFNNPATIVFWKDGSKTVVKCQEGDVYSKETGLALCIAKKALGNQPNFNNVFRKWIPEE